LGGKCYFLGSEAFIYSSPVPAHIIIKVNAIKNAEGLPAAAVPIRKNGQRNFCFVRYPFLLIFISMVKKEILC